MKDLMYQDTDDDIMETVIIEDVVEEIVEVTETIIIEEFIECCDEQKLLVTGRRERTDGGDKSNDVLNLNSEDY